MESRTNSSSAKAPMTTIAIGSARLFQASFSKALALKNVKATGIDAIHAEMLKVELPTSVEVLSPFFNEVWEREEIPDWRLEEGFDSENTKERGYFCM